MAVLNSCSLIYPVVANDGVLEICTALSSTASSLHEHLSQTNTSYIQKCRY